MEGAVDEFADEAPVEENPPRLGEDVPVAAGQVEVVGSFRGVHDDEAVVRRQAFTEGALADSVAAFQDHGLVVAGDLVDIHAASQDRTASTLPR